MAKTSKTLKAAAMKEVLLVSYRLSHLLYKDKVRFYYALKGRDGKSGMLKILKAQQLSKSVMLLEKGKQEDIRAFLEHWKCPFVARQYFVKAAQ